MRRNFHLWKFWAWEISLTLVLIGIAVGSLLLAPELATVIEERQIEAQVLAVFLMLVVMVVAYRLTTGVMVGVAKWLIRLLGTGLAVACITLVPAIVLRPLLKPEYVAFASPFAALFVLWCLYGFTFFIRWQARVFYSLVDEIR